MSDNTEVGQTGYTTFISEDGKTKIFVVAGNQTFTDESEARAYVASHQVEITVKQFMDYVAGNQAKFFADKKGEMPCDRALQAMVTRLKNAATACFTWAYSQG